MRRKTPPPTVEEGRKLSLQHLQAAEQLLKWANGNRSISPETVKKVKYLYDLQRKYSGVE